MSEPLILALDQGTTSTRAIIFDQNGVIWSQSSRELTQSFPGDGWVEHDPAEIWASSVAVCRDAIAGAGFPVALGITNQRETTVVWDRDTGEAIYPAIVWQDRRTAQRCEALRQAGHEPLVSQRTGLLLDPYFSATKVAWILDHVDGARARAEAGHLAFGTIDSFLIWKLTGGALHATDATNASRTLLFDIHRQCWDQELLDLLDVPAAVLPQVRDCASDYGRCVPDIFGQSVPIAGVAGDQQAATVGQACFHQGMVKSTYGTGCFAVMNAGLQAPHSANRLLTTVAYRLDGEVTYALEGSIFVAGAAVQWLRDGLGVIGSASETESLAMGLRSNEGVYMVPAFTGLGAPHWDPHARGALLGMTRDTGVAHLVRAALESVCYQTNDLIEAMARDSGAPPATLRVDGGMVANNWLVQYLADILDVRVERPRVLDTTALGVAYLAGLQVGVYADLDAIGKLWAAERSFVPTLDQAKRKHYLAGWASAVGRIRSA
jgi:glycerol kinase